MTRPSTDHVYSDAKDSGAFKCDHCGARYQPQLPMPLNVWCEQGKGFLLMHRLCPKPEAPSRQMALPGTEQRRKPCPGCGREQCPQYGDECWRNSGCPKEPPNPPLPSHIVDASTDEPAPEIDPPGPYAEFDRMYPVALTHTDLFMQLQGALTEQQWDALPRSLPWDTDTGIFNAIANWVRRELAHQEAGTREPIAGLTIPRREPMPEKLAELLGVKPKQKKGARPLTSPKRRKSATP